MSWALFRISLYALKAPLLLLRKRPIRFHSRKKTLCRCCRHGQGPREIMHEKIVKILFRTHFLLSLQKRQTSKTSTACRKNIHLFKTFAHAQHLNIEEISLSVKRCGGMLKIEATHMNGRGAVQETAPPEAFRAGNLSPDLDIIDNRAYNSTGSMCGDLFYTTE